jgi:hypothetical protein
MPRIGWRGAFSEARFTRARRAGLCKGAARQGRAVRCRLDSLGVLARPGPDQGVAFAVLVIEQIRVDRCVERGIIELEREVVAALV